MERIKAIMLAILLCITMSLVVECVLAHVTITRCIVYGKWPFEKLNVYYKNNHKTQTRKIKITIFAKTSLDDPWRKMQEKKGSVPPESTKFKRFEFDSQIQYWRVVIIDNSTVPQVDTKQDWNNGEGWRPKKPKRKGLPKSTGIDYKAYPGAYPYTIVEEFLTGVTDWIDGPLRMDLYDQVVSEGHKVSPVNPMAEFDALAINCREFKVTSLESNFPLNDASFRIALSYIYGMDEKQEDIYEYVQAPWYFPLGNPVPPAQEPWHDESIVMPDTDFDVAWDILQADGYEVDGDGHLSKGGVACRDLEVLYTAGSLYAEQGPVNGFATNFNEFITYIGATAPTMTIVPVEFMTLVMELMTYRDYDFICYDFTDLGLYADWLYDFLHSDNTFDWGWNFAGIVDWEFDYYTEIVMTSLDVDEIMDAASKVQQKFVYELMPWFPIGIGLDFCTTARDERGELMNIISMSNYGPRNDWSWMTLDWKTTSLALGHQSDGTIRTALREEPHTMNLYTENTPYGWQFLDRAIDTLLRRDPETLWNMPWIATDYEIEYWTEIPELGIEEGSIVTFYLRQDVYWHDGEPLTAYDCANNLRILRKYKPGRYSRVWANLVYEEADGPYKFNVYFSNTSLYYADYVAETALLAPKHILDLAEEQVEDGVLLYFEDWAPCDLPYWELTGEDPPEKYPFMTQLVGCGPFVFDYYDWYLAEGRVQKYEEFFVNAPAIGSVVGEWRVDPDTSYSYVVLVQNIGATEDSEEGRLIPVTVDISVFIDGLLALEEVGIPLDSWEGVLLGQYNTGLLSAGEHHIVVEVYEAGTLTHTYDHTFVSTIRADINTYTGSQLDFKVDIKDIARAAKAFGSTAEGYAQGTRAGLRWDPPADVNDDLRVDIKDIAYVAKNFGWTA